jgi:hypothetical protein
MDAFFEQRLALLAKAEKEKGAKGKRAKKFLKSHKSQQSTRKADGLQARENGLGTAHRMFAEALVRILAALRVQGKYAKPEFEFGSDEIRFNHRVATYTLVNKPAPLTYESYLKISDVSKYDATTLFEASMTYLEKCKALVSALNKELSESPSDRRLALKLRGLLKVVIGTNILVTREMTTPKDESKIVHVDFAQYPELPVISLVERAAEKR